jgi:hypothetical protein
MVRQQGADWDKAGLCASAHRFIQKGDEASGHCAILSLMNERSLQDILEWVVLGLLIAVAALVVLWVGGWLFTFLGTLLKGLAGVVWALLRVLVPVLIVVAVVYFVMRFIQKPKTA